MKETSVSSKAVHSLLFQRRGMSDIDFLVNDFSMATQCARDFDTDINCLLDFMSGDGTKKNKMSHDPCNGDSVYHMICPRDICHVPNEVEATITMETADAIDFYSMEVQLSPVVTPTLKSCSTECSRSLSCCASPEPNLVSSMSHTQQLTSPIAPEFNPSGYIPLQTTWTPQCQDMSMSMRECRHSPGIQFDSKFLPFEPNFPPSLVSMLEEHREMFHHTCNTPVNPFSKLSPAMNTTPTERKKVCCITSSSYDISIKKKLSKNTQATVKQRKMKHRQPSPRFKKPLNRENHETASSVVKMTSAVGGSGITSWNKNSDNELGSLNNVSTGSFCRSLENASCKESRKGSRKEPAPHTGMKLWQFLLKVLVEEQNTTIAHWISKENGTFCVSDPERLAKLWGEHRNRPEMNYDKLSRAVRYYYHKNLLDKAPKRLCYQFGYYSRWWEHLEMADSQFRISAISLPSTGPAPLIDILE